MSEAARLVDELTTLLYSPFGTYRGRPQVACGACAKQADKPESVVHDSDCPVYRLIRAEEANTAIIRANAEEIADLEDKRDELEAQVNALTAERDAIQALVEDRESRLRQAHRDTTTMTKAAHGYKKERDALRERSERMENGSCNCASIAPTYPTFRSDPHMPGCAFHRIDVLKNAIHMSLERMGRLLALTRTEQEVESLLRATLAAASGEGEA